MSYIVFNLISPYDGYEELPVETWDDVVATVKHATKHNQEAKQQVNQWLKGKIDKIAVGSTLIFVTSGFLNENKKF